MSEIPVAPFRERFLELKERGVMSEATLARSLGWTAGRRRLRNGDPSGSFRDDVSRVRRQLGLIPERGRYQEKLTYPVAVKLADALDLDYTSVGV